MTSTAAATDAESNLRTNNINYNDSQKVSATNSDQISNVKTMLAPLSGSSSKNSENESENRTTNVKNSQAPLNHSTNRIRQPTLDDDINNRNGFEQQAPTKSASHNTMIATNSTTTATAPTASLSRTLTRNSCNSVNGQSIAKSWYARCSRWRSQSCDRRKHSAIRYSWNNMIDHRPV